jgi:hypothetical protein
MLHSSFGTVVLDIGSGSLDLAVDSGEAELADRNRYEHFSYVLDIDL